MEDDVDCKALSGFRSRWRERSRAARDGSESVIAPSDFGDDQSLNPDDRLLLHLQRYSMYLTLMHSMVVRVDP